MTQNLVKEILKRHKIAGYTSYEVGGMGDSGLRGQGLSEEKNVKIEVVWRRRALKKSLRS